MSITINGDNIIESDETFKVTLSNAVNATIADATGIGTILNDDGTVAAKMIAQPGSSNGNTPLITVSPNPAMNIIYVQLQGYTGKITLQLTDMQNKVLKENTSEPGNVKYVRQQFNVSGVASGIYFIVATDEKGNKQTEKVIITH